VAAYRRWRRVVEEIGENREMLADPEMKEMAEEELKSLDAEKDQLEADIQLLLLPKDPNDDKGVILEIRAGTGGDETCSACTRVSPRRTAGGWRPSRPPSRSGAVSKRSSPPWKVRGSTPS